MSFQISHHAARRCKLGAAATAVATLAALAPQSQAATATTNLSVSATIAGSCTLSATAAVAFGTYAPSGANASSALDAAGTLLSTCSTGLSATITLGQGANANIATSTDAIPARRMVGNPSVFLSYVLYSDVGRSTVWGNTDATGLSITGTGTASTSPVYGRIAAGQGVAPGSYLDTIVATITF